MYKFITLRCRNCHAVMLNLPDTEVAKLYGTTLYCECCGSYNLLEETDFNHDPTLGTLTEMGMAL